MAGRELPGIAHADADLFREHTYALIAKSSETVVAGVQPHTPVPADEPGESHDPRVSAFVKILEKIGARPLSLRAPQPDYAVGPASHPSPPPPVPPSAFFYDPLYEIPPPL